MTILLVGMQESTSRQLCAGLESVVAVDGVDEARAFLETGEVNVLIAEASTPGLESLLSELPAEVSLGCCLQRDEIELDRVRWIFHHPLDAEEMAIRLSRDLGLNRVRTPGVSPEEQAIQRVFNKHRPRLAESLARLQELQRVGPSNPELRRAAVAEAHKLSGTLGTFGFSQAGSLAHELELALPGTDYEPLLDRTVQALTRVLEPASPSAKADEAEVRVLVVNNEDDFLHQVSLDGANRGWEVVVARDLERARQRLRSERFAALIVDLGVHPSTRAFLQELSRGGLHVPILTVTNHDDLLDRVELARLGGDQAFLTKPVSAMQTLEELERLLSHQQVSRFTVLALDDDPVSLAVLRRSLDGPQVRVETLNEPLRFWRKLEEIRPDLVILDMEMEPVNGVEICRALRNDPLYASLPVIFLTGHRERETILRVYTAGADDYVTKPFLREELITRVMSRLERSQMMRKLSERDPLTGLSNRRKATQEVEQMLRLASRHQQKFAIAMVDLDRFKGVNDRHGHAVGDLVLRRLALLFKSNFRGEDVVSRWGGEEFLVGMYAMGLDDAVHRLAETLEQLRGLEFQGPQESFHTSFSAGVALFPDDGEDLQQLCQVADEALYQAKASGRNRIVAARQSRGPGPDFVVLSPDPETLLQSLRSRGYQAATEGDPVRGLIVDDRLPVPPTPDVPVLIIDEKAREEGTRGVLSRLRAMLRHQ